MKIPVPIRATANTAIIITTRLLLFIVYQKLLFFCKSNAFSPTSQGVTDYLSYIGNANKGLGLNYDIPNATKELKEYYMTTPVFIGSSTARDQIGMIIQYMVGQKMSVEQAFETAYNTCVRGGN